MSTTIHTKLDPTAISFDTDPSVISESEAAKLFDNVFTAETSQASLEAADKLFNTLCEQPQSFRTLEQFNILKQLAAAATDKKSGTKRESAMIAYSSLYAKFIPAARCTEPIFLGTVDIILDGLADKGEVVRESADYAMDVLFMYLPVEAVASEFLTCLETYLKRPSSKWQGKVGALNLLSKLAKKAVGGSANSGIIYEMLASRLEKLIPVVEDGMHDLKADVSKSAVKTMQAITGLIDNEDVKKHIPLLINNMAKPSQTLLNKAIKDLSQTTFIHPVTSPSLALVTPLLHRVLSNPSTSQDMLRQTVVIIENLTKLVHNPIEARTFLPQLIPGVQRVRDHAALPEVRGLAESSMNVVEKAMRGEGGREGFVDFRVSIDQVTKRIDENVRGSWVDEAADDAKFWEMQLKPYISMMVKEAVNINESARVRALVEPYLIQIKGQSKAEEIGEAIQNYYTDEERKRDSRSASPDDDGVEIVNTPFSLAYGGMLLLSHTKLRLLKGHRYGLCGRNGAGKSTLMRSIAEGKLEGFPSKDEVRTSFVEHTLQGEEAQFDLVTFISNDKNIIIEESKDEDVRRRIVKEALNDVGFDDERTKQTVGSLSGGWKMKLELARAMLLKADILLLDEPTNHLDQKNVKWLENYLVTHPEITSLIVSHDSGFLDTVCTDIYHYESKKLAHYRGNLSAFLKKRPEARAYNSLQESSVQFKFPSPGLLTGVRSLTRSIMKMSNVTFTYPGAIKPSILNCTVQLSLSSRVAILGPNGAGKTTLIKLLTGELIGQSGIVSIHPNARVAYVPQHSLEYVNMHTEKTPLDYLRWRFGNGDDKETALKATRVVSDEEKRLMETPVDIGDGKGPKKIEKIIGRQKYKKSFQYEIKWQNLMPKYNTMISRETLLKHNLNKMVQDFDDKEAAREGLGYRELTAPALRQHFEDVALPEDIAAHNEIGSLSGGQRVKVVLAAAMWNNPHILVLDEPTNYLDRESMGGLSSAIKEFRGGVVIISHNAEFMKNLLNEEWYVESGKVATRGGNYDSDLSRPGSSAASRANSAPSSAAASGAEDNGDSDPNLGFKAKKPKKKKLTRNQMKEREVRRKLRHLEWLNSPKGTPKPVDTDDEA